MQAESSSTRIELIDGLKGLAILAVIYTHTFGISNTFEHVRVFSINGYLLSPMTIFNNSHYAVTVFFILSGFLLALPYAKGSKKMISMNDVLSFYRTRALRLLPAYYFTLTVILAIAAPDIRPGASFWHALKFGTFMFQSTNWFVDFSPALGPSYIPLWFMGLLFWGSVLFPALLLLIQKLGLRSAVLLVLAFSLAIRLLFSMEFSILDSWHADSLSHIFCRIDDFMLGIGLAFLRSDGSQPKRLPMLVGCSAIFIIFAFLLIDSAKLHQMPFLIMSITYLMVGIGCTLLIDVLLAAPKSVQVFFEFWPLRLLGRMSYSLYLLHGTAIYALQPTLNVYRFVRYIALVLTLSWFSYRYIENGSIRNWRELLPTIKRRIRVS